MTNPHAYIKLLSSHPEYPQKILRSPNLLAKIDLFKELHKEEKHTKKEIRKLSKLLINQHTPSNPDILNQYKIPKSDILKGVHCPNCSLFPMERKQGRWICRDCSFFSKDAHISALTDYGLLFQPTITNQQCRDFLRISSRSTAHKMLVSMIIPSSGETKARKYELSALLDKD